MRLNGPINVFEKNGISDFELEEGGYNIIAIYDEKSNRWIVADCDYYVNGGLDIQHDDPTSIKAVKWKHQFEYLLNRRLYEKLKIENEYI